MFFFDTTATPEPCFSAHQPGDAKDPPAASGWWGNYHESRSHLNFQGLSWQCREFNESLAKQMKIYLYRNNMKPTTRQHRSKKQVYNDESAPRPGQHLGQSREIPKERSAAEVSLGRVWKCQNHQLQKTKPPTPGRDGIIRDGRVPIRIIQMLEAK